MKELKLTRGKVALVDDEDFYWLSQWNWQAVSTKGTWYAVRQKKKGALRNTDNFQTFLHRVIMRVSNSEIFVDHKDHDGLNNTKSNLRLCSKSENDRNSRKSTKRATTSRYLGVAWKKDKGKWRVDICKNRERTFVGYFTNEEDAAKAYDEAANKLFGEFANLNFK